jgi:hypothetical protein
MSFPCAIGTMPAATAEPAPPLEPPGVRSWLRALNVVPPQFVGAEPLPAPRRHVGAADDVCAAATDILDHGVVCGREDIGTGRNAVSGGMPRSADIVLDERRHAAERPERESRSEILVSGLGLPHSLLAVHIDHGVERGIHLVDTLERGRQSLLRRNLAAGNRLCKTGRRPCI